MIELFEAYFNIYGMQALLNKKYEVKLTDNVFSQTFRSRLWRGVPFESWTAALLISTSIPFHF